MDDGEIYHSSNIFFTSPSISSCLNFDELRNTKKCTHTHTCNPPGPAIPTHTHTCYHTHTQLLSAGEDDVGGENELKKPKKRLLGNREAVKKYREKKKAHEAYLEEEVKKLRCINQQLLRRLESKAALEAEILRLKSLLVDLRAKVDAELGLYPLKMCGRENLRCGGRGECLMGDLEVVGGERSSVPAVLDSQIRPNADLSLNLEVVDGVQVGGSMLLAPFQANLMA
ncbi:basic leucine zipper 23-like [Phalaenopsis equestris]|uniref:basic leucine zipper 23-like n=1 Tax=Phalaenopsis equestris TaxID=78828 RepID=UPI0009E30A95|nr:basic leucine zipper 23-like [Phalaenopsis equestris]XP_020582362.1 basic leucine zipper 23-like [Phalaenopsis equestris]